MADAQEPPAKEEDPTSQRFQRGDYSLHIFLEEGRALLGDSVDSTVDPVVSFKAFGKTKATKIVEDVGGAASIYWGEHYFITLEQAEPDILMTSALEIEVKDHNTMMRDALIGAFVLDLSYLYAQEKHAILHKWFILSNPNDSDFEKVRGYLKVGIAFLHENDKPVDLTVQENVSKETDDVMMPPEIKPKAKQIIVRLLKAESLPALDSMSKSLDAYVTAKIASASIKSSVITADKETLSAYWYEDLYLPYVEPGLSPYLTLTFSDKDTLSPKDDLVGSIQFSLQQIQIGTYANYFWSNLFGAATDPNNDDAADLMSSINKLGSHWRGRVLMSIRCVDDHNAQLKVENIATPEIKDTVENCYEATTGYMVRAQLFNATGLPKKSGEYSIKIKFCEAELQSPVGKANNRRIDWFKKLPARIASIPEGAEKTFPDVIVYLMDDDSPICFKRIPYSACLDPNAAPTWLQLGPDKSLDKVKNDWEAGVVGVRIHICNEDEVPDEGNWNKDPIRPQEKDYILVCNLYQCRNLPAADSSGMADPYVKFYIDGYEVSTEKEPKEGTLNPTWYTPIPLRLKVPLSDIPPPIWVFVWDWDRIGDDDLIGMTNITLNEAILNSDTVAQPKWYPLGMGRAGTEMGEILLSFNLFDHENIPLYNLEPEYEDVDIEINVLGLRDLHPAVGSLPVHKAFVKFDLRGLKLTGGSLIKNSLETQPQEPGRNPNINTVLSFSCMLPKDPLYCPALTCTVHDQLFSGLLQPHIGTFTMDLGKYKKKAKALIKKVSAEAKGQGGLLERIEKDNAQRKNPGFLESQAAEGLKYLVKKESAKVEEVKLEFPDPNRALELLEVLAGCAMRPGMFDRSGKKPVEINVPDPQFYMEIGYNREPGDDLKHYRFTIDTSIEESDFYGQSPFDQYELKKGQSRGLDESIFDSHDKLDAAGQKTNERVTGIFKGLVKIIPHKKSDVVQGIRRGNTVDMSDVSTMLNNFVEREAEFNDIKEKLLRKTKCLVRVYLVDAFDLEQKDRGSHSDPYVVLKMGKQVYSGKKDYLEDVSNPKFFKLYEFDTTLPGESTLKVQVWDHDDFLSDEKIGTTKIDLEDRFFSKRYMNIPHQPIETRKLMHNSSRRPQGYIRLWVDIHPSGVEVPPPLDISERPPVPYEARIIIWKSKDVEDMDVEGVSDLYVRAFINRDEGKETDTHFRCPSGKGSWNWRMKFPLELPLEAHRCSIQIWDRDYLSRNDFIAESTFDFEDMAKEAWENSNRVKKYGEGEDSNRDEKFWVNCMKRNKEGGFEQGGKILVSFELIPKNRAEACPVGEGRDNPNVDPFLPPPIGRFEWTLNPFKLISQMCGPEFKLKICLAVCCILCVLILVFTLPMFFSNGVAIAIFG